MDRLDQISTFNRIYQVSRETTLDLEKFEKILIEANKSVNLIAKSTISQIWHRHILDSIQVIDFIDKNDKKLVDLGTGAGFPGLVIAIAAKWKKIPLKICLVEKSKRKTKFLREAIKKLSLDVDVVCENILIDPKKITGDVYVARAFKPLPIILRLIHNYNINFKKFFVFLGKSGGDQLLQASKAWDIKYKQRISITNTDSFIIEINKLNKKVN
jgi:16S rRNA (guanine527-N7)-methyltransferase